MSTLFFDVMDMYVRDADWSELPDTDKEMPEEDDYSEDSDAEIGFTWDDLFY